MLQCINIKPDTKLQMNTYKLSAHIASYSGPIWVTEDTTVTIFNKEPQLPNKEF
jgi:hypothetical protein